MSPATTVIVGGGLAGQRCAEALRRLGHDGPIVLVCGEPVPPYDRPPLSKALLAGAGSMDAPRLRDDAWYAANAVDLLLGTRATALDAVARRLVVAGGRELPFDHLVVATGAVPRRLPMLDRCDNALTLRDLADARELRGRLGAGVRVLVVGAGFLGLEVAATATGLGAEVAVVEAAPAPASAILGIGAGARLAELHRRHGVAVRTGTQIRRVLRGGRDELRGVELDTGTRLAADVAVVAVGAVPDTRWLSGAGLPADGLPVATGGTTAVPDVLAAGDAARPPHPVTGAPTRSEHWEAAARSGAAAARTIVGVPHPPEPPPSFWSDQHGVRLHLVGDPRRADAVTTDGDPETDTYISTYWRAGRPAAVLLVGCPAELPAARRRVATGIPDPERRAA